MKGIILAGGAGTRLAPLTNIWSKQLVPVYNKPLIYYPLSVLILSGIREILIISSPRDLPQFQSLCGDGSQLGLSISYEVQEKAEGLAQAFLIGEYFISNDSCSLILGDNIFYGHGLSPLLKSCSDANKGATIFAYPVKDPERYGVVVLDDKHKPTEIVEKPMEFKSNLAIPGLYYFDNNVVDIAKDIKPSPRGELEITSVIEKYLESETLTVNILSRGTAWFDAGTPSSLLDSANFVQTVELRQGLMIGCIEECAWRMGLINDRKLLSLADIYRNNEYGQYLNNLLSNSR